MTRPAKCSYFYAFYISEIKVFLTYDCRLHSTAKKRIRINFSIRKYRDKEVNEFRVAFTQRKIFPRNSKDFFGETSEIINKGFFYRSNFWKIALSYFRIKQYKTNFITINSIWKDTFCSWNIEIHLLGKWND